MNLKAPIEKPRSNDRGFFFGPNERYEIYLRIPLVFLTIQIRIESPASPKQLLCRFAVDGIDVDSDSPDSQLGSGDHSIHTAERIEN